MAAPGTGHKGGIIQIGKETAWGTPVAATIKLPTLSSDLKLQADVFPDNTLHGNPWPRTMHQGPRKVVGPFAVPLLFEGELELFRGVMGLYSNSVVETGVRDHTFKVGPTLNPYTLQDQKGDVVTASTFRVSGAKFNTLRISGTAGQGPEGNVALEFGVIGKDKESNQTPTGALSFPPLLYVKFDLATVTVDDGTSDAAADVRVRSFEVMIENMLAEDRHYLGSLLIDEPVRGGQFKATWKFQQEFQTLTLFNAYRAASDGSPKLVFQHPTTIGAASKREFEVRSNQAKLTDFSDPVDGPGVIIATSTWESYFDGVDTTEASPLVMRVRNTESALT